MCGVTCSVCRVCTVWRVVCPGCHTWCDMQWDVWCVMAARPRLCKVTSCTHWTQNLPQWKLSTLLLHQWKPVWQINKIQISSQSHVFDGTKVINHQSTSTHQLPPCSEVFFAGYTQQSVLTTENGREKLYTFHHFVHHSQAQALKTTKLAACNSTRPTWPDPGSKTHQQQCFTTSVNHWKTIIEWIVTRCGCRLELGREKVRAALSQKNIHLLSPTNYHNLLARQLKQWQVSIIPLYSKLPI